jgi:hypothetical protein
MSRLCHAVIHYGYNLVVGVDVHSNDMSIRLTIRMTIGLIILEEIIIDNLVYYF